MNFTIKNNTTVIIDEDDYEMVSKYNWYLLKGYAVHMDYSSDKPRLLYMHRLINKTPDNWLTDHINQNKLDNRKSNLRSVNNSLSQYNQRKKVNKYGVRGVGRHMGRWRAYIGVDGKNIYLGHFDTLEAAAEARKKAERKYYD